MTSKNQKKLRLKILNRDIKIVKYYTIHNRRIGNKVITIYNEKENPGRDFLISFRQFFFSRNCTRSSVSKGSHPRWKSFPSINASSWWTSTVAVGSQRNFSQVHSLLKIAHDSKLILGYVALTDNFVSCFCISTDLKRRLDRATYCFRSHRRHIGRTQFVIDRRNINHKSKACWIHTSK